MATTNDARRQATLKSRLDPDFGPWLKRMRQQRGLKMQQFAEKCDIGYTTLQTMENEVGREATLAVALFVKIADALGIELGYVLYKAGFDIGRDGINMARLKRVETAAEAFELCEPELRSALAEAMAAFDAPVTKARRKDATVGNLVTGSWLREFALGVTDAGSDDRDRLMRIASLLDEREKPVEHDPETDRLIVRLGMGLARLDVATERLREDGFMRPLREPVEPVEPVTKPRFWSVEEDAFLRANPDMSSRDLAVRLGRTYDAVRVRRVRNSDEGGGS